MIRLLIMILICTVLSHTIQLRPELAREYGRGTKPSYKIILFGIIVYLILFAGLRTRYNDTTTYIRLFAYSTQSSLSGSILNYGGFEVYQYVIKRLVSSNPQVFLFITAVITSTLYVHFIDKYSDHFAESMFLFLIGPYLSTMAGIKQALATAIVLYAIPAYFKKRYAKAVLTTLIAMAFHPYVICLGCIVFLDKLSWDKRTIAISALFALAFMNLERLLGVIDNIGKDYSESISYIFDSYTIHPMRVIVEAVPVFLSYRYRSRINESGDRWLIAGVNLQTIGFVFIFLGLFFNPIYLGRLHMYFTIISMITIPKLLEAIWGKSSSMKGLYYMFMFAYFMADMTKLGAAPLTFDPFGHTSIMSLIK